MITPRNTDDKISTWNEIFKWAIKPKGNTMYGNLD
jgi:hypothetical protein